jgi:hypothetical protein
MSDKSDFNLIDEMARGCLYRGGESERLFLKGYFWTWVAFIVFIVVGFGIETFLRWLL